MKISLRTASIQNTIDTYGVLKYSFRPHEFIQRLSRFSRIIAMTFTNKAALEMKTRII
ncbi:MAG: UvrD-helicase domain-containing protein, partial [Flavobacteriia bacterium]